MNTAATIVRIKRTQAIFAALAVLNLKGDMYPKEANVRNGSTYDFVVVGGGSAGAIVAARLVEANFSTLIIEAGENPGSESESPGYVTYIKNSRMDWNYTSESNGKTGQCHKKDGSLLGRVLGGSGNTNYMIYGRGFPSDFEKFYKATNDSSWRWKNMLKYFLKTEKLDDIDVLKSAYGRYHSDNGTIGVIKENRSICDEYLIGFEEAGESVLIDNIGVGSLGYSSSFYNILDGVRTEGASAYLSPLKDNPNIHITRNSMATKIVFDENKNAVGVEFVKAGRTIKVNARKEVIISAGPIHSPKLLMLSGIGPRDQLEKLNITVLSNLPVGKNLQTTVGALLVFRTNRPANPEPFNKQNFPAPLIIGHSALNKSSGHTDYRTLNFIVDDYSYFLSFCGFTLGLQNSICDRLHLLAENSQLMTSVLFNLNPKSRGNITLNGTDPFAQPKINYGYYSNGDDLDAIVKHMIHFVKIEGTPYFQNLRLELMDATKRCGMYPFGSREYFRCYALCMVTGSGNVCGTCSMGSVVDSKLKVIGVNRIRVVDASIMPNTIGSSIYATVAALAEKAAEMILESS